MPLTYILTNNYFNSTEAEFVQEDHIITVDTSHGVILRVEKATKAPSDLDVIDLRGLTVLPGFVDTHVHFFLHPYDETSWDDQVTRESLPERTIRAVNHARVTLLAGFTAVRDLGTEGAGDADIILRKCISSPVSLIPGPRYFCASRAIVPTGSYGPKSELYPSQQGVEGITAAQAADGPDQCAKVVRQQIGAGVDWVKVYGGDNAVQTSPRAGSDSISLWTKAEWESLVSTARSLGVKVAVHSNTPEAALAALEAGASTLEHGREYNEQVFAKIREKRATWTPTLSAYYTIDPNGPKWAGIQQSFKMALKENAKVSYVPKLGIPIACGGDTGVFAHGKNALELQLMHSLGMPARQVLQAATLMGWRCLRSVYWDGEQGEERLEDQMGVQMPMGDNELPFGYIGPGFAADIIATSGDLVENDEKGFADAVSADNIVFVMKAGKVYKTGGRPVL